MNLDILSGRQTFRYIFILAFPFDHRFLLTLFVRWCYRDAFRKELESVAANGHTFEKCKEILKTSESQCQNLPRHLVC
jgi:hypothetical protein